MSGIKRPGYFPFNTHPIWCVSVGGCCVRVKERSHSYRLNRNPVSVLSMTPNRKWLDKRKGTFFQNRQVKWKRMNVTTQTWNERTGLPPSDTFCTRKIDLGFRFSIVDPGPVDPRWKVRFFVQSHLSFRERLELFYPFLQMFTFDYSVFRT